MQLFYIFIDGASYYLGSVYIQTVTWYATERGKYGLISLLLLCLN